MYIFLGIPWWNTRGSMHPGVSMQVGWLSYRGTEPEKGPGRLLPCRALGWPITAIYGIIIAI